MIHGDNRYNGVNVHPIGINHIIFLLRLPWNLLNQFNNTIIIRPPVMFLTIALNLLIMSMDYFESPHPSPHVPLQILMGFLTLEFLLTHHFEPTWLLSSCTVIAWKVYNSITLVLYVSS
jgi:hypothetical protein